jgi:HPt (histidine-containing phosphotransfer) domain-containing protein
MIDETVLEELEASVAGDTAFVADLVEAYVADSTDQVGAIEAALGAGDAAALVRPAHTLKSSSATLGAAELAATARTLEMAARAGNLDEADALQAADAVRGQWEAAIAGLRAWLERSKPA